MPRRRRSRDSEGLAVPDGRLRLSRPRRGARGGDREADAEGAALDLAILAGRLPALDRGARETGMGRLQQSVGNQAVQRLVAELPAPKPVTPQPASPAEIGRRAAAGHGSGVAVAHGFAMTGLPAPKGINDLREIAAKNGVIGSLFGYTHTEAEEQPRARLGEPRREGDAWAATVRPTKTKPPESEAWYPAPGRHVIEVKPPRGKPSTIPVVVTPEWSETIKTGEQEHVDDHRWAWKLTWETIATIINKLATTKLPARPDREAAEKAARERILADLPEKLRPVDLTPEGQDARWGIEDPKSVFLRMYRASLKLRDAPPNRWHTPGTQPTHFDEKRHEFVGDEVELIKGTSEIGTHKSEDEMRKYFEALT